MTDYTGNQTPSEFKVAPLPGIGNQITKHMPGDADTPNDEPWWTRQPTPAPTPINGCDAGTIAFYVRDLLAAAGYDYNPRRDLHEQAMQHGAKVEPWHFAEPIAATAEPQAYAEWRRQPDPDLGDDPDGDLEGADYPPFPAGSTR